ncbi:MAG: GIY-YIG nuclease family protein [Candidatus Yanofskybacteria bacterium]|nr:GIY-YIG nuclease family protein [Candidatus Yanofskybacteria bacterium]
MKPQDITHIAKTAPRTPGVYLWRTARRKLLYVGKAVDLRARISSYANNPDTRIRALCDEAATIEWETVPTEIEALILESQRIKALKPKYNIVMRDDKQYTYVGVTKEEFPQLIVTHQVRPARAGIAFKRLIGPFTDSSALRATLRWLRGPFPYCTCKQKHHVKCLNAHIGVCRGYCCLRHPSTAAQRAEYRRDIAAITDILEGRRDALIRRIERDMKRAGTAHQLERAIALRTLADQARQVFTNATLVRRTSRSAAHDGALPALRAEFRLPRPPRRIEGYDIAHLQGAHPSGAMVVFRNGTASPADHRLFNIRTRTGGDIAQLKEMLERRMKHTEWPLPDLIVVDGGRAQLNAALASMGDNGIPVIAFTKDLRHRGDHVLSSLDARIRMLSDLPRIVRDLITHIDAEAHRFSIRQYRSRHRKGSVE